jgi:outer membrane protein assembly factor BamD (BamD/ComL family)
MSVTGISSSDMSQYLDPSSLQSNFQNFQKKFQQLGQDLQSGNLSQAQTDFAALQPQGAPPVASSNGQTSSNSVADAFKQLSQDLQSGNLSAAQQDFATVQQDLQQQFSGAGAASGHHHHHHHHDDSSQGSSSSQNPIDQLLSQLGQALQSGNLSAAQSGYSSLLQEFQQFGALASSSTSSTTSATTSTNPLNVSV